MHRSLAFNVRVDGQVPDILCHLGKLTHRRFVRLPAVVVDYYSAIQDRTGRGMQDLTGQTNRKQGASIML